MFKKSPGNRDQGENIFFLFSCELHILLKTIGYVSFKELQNQSVFLNISLDASMAMAGAVLAFVWY